jgi:heme/copper-type cytochrome/quinol oxidase subunit 1
MAMGQRGNRNTGRARKNLLGRVAVPLTAAAMLVAGLVFLAQPVSQENVGWFAYAPLPTGPVVLQGLMIMGPWTWAGVALIGIGLLLLAFWSGYRTGRQARDRGVDSR